MRRTGLTLLLLLVALPVRAALFSTEKFSLYGDFRARIETDWDSETADGVPRDDRTRIRVRARLGFQYDPTEHWRFEMRIRSGAEGSQQSPHITLVDFNGNDTGDASFNFDRWYLRGDWGGFWFWAGRNNVPFWHADEMEYDDDVTMAGLALGWAREFQVGELELSGGFFSPPVGMRAFTGQMSGLQVAYHARLSEVDWTFAATASRFRADPENPNAGELLSNNGFRHYLPLEFSTEAVWRLGGRRMSVVADLFYNLENYPDDDPDPFTVENRDQVRGLALGAFYGDLNKAGGWLVGYEYLRMETFAVHNSYSQDDPVRWGSLIQTRASNMKGHELRGGYAFRDDMNILARLFLMKSITTVEDGNRFRADFNYRF